MNRLKKAFELITARRIASALMCLIIMASVIGCAKTQDGGTDEFLSNDGRKRNSAFRAASGEAEELAIRFVEAVRDEDYEAMLGMTSLELLAPKAPWSDKIEHIADVVDNRCIVYWDSATESIFFADGQWVHGILDSTVLGDREVTRAQSECVGIAESKQIDGSTVYVTLAMSADDSKYADEDDIVFISVGVKQDSTGTWLIAPIEIYNEYNPAERFKENDYVYFLAHDKAIVSVDGNVLEAVEPPDGIELRDESLYILNDYCSGAPVIVDVDYGYVQLQDWVTIGILEREGSDDVISVFTNKGPRTNDTQYDIALLSITQPEGTYDYIYAELEQKAYEVTETAQEYLKNGNVEGIEQLIENTRLNYNDRHIDEWDRNDSLEIAVTKILQISELTWRIEFDCFLTIAETGNRYSAMSSYEFSYDTDIGDWLLTGMHSTGLFGRSSNYWTAVG